MDAWQENHCRIIAYVHLSNCTYLRTSVLSSVGCWVSCSRWWTSSCSGGGTLPDYKNAAYAVTCVQILQVDHLVYKRACAAWVTVDSTLIRGTTRVRRAVGTFTTTCLLCRVGSVPSVLMRKLEQCDVTKCHSRWMLKIMVNDWWCSSMLLYIQTIFNCMGPIQAQKDEISWSLEHGQLKEKVAGFLC